MYSLSKFSPCDRTALVVVDIQIHFSEIDLCRQTAGVVWLKWTDFQFSRDDQLVSFRNEVEIIVRYDDTLVWISVDTIKMTLKF